MSVPLVGQKKLIAHLAGASAFVAGVVGGMDNPRNKAGIKNSEAA
mgnify:CR=1 FL=1